MSTTILHILHSIDLSALAVVVPVIVVLVHVVAYFYDPYGIRLYPGPFLAKFSDAWLGIVCKNGHRSEVIHEMHTKYGTSWFFVDSYSDSSSDPCHVIQVLL